MYSLIKEVISCKDFAALDIICHQKLSMIVRDLERFDDKQIRYVKNQCTHVDFLIYHKFDKIPILVIEVDGYTYHKKGTAQDERDIIKNSVLDKCGIPFLRLSTTGSMEKEQIISKLNEILKNKV